MTQFAVRCGFAYPGGFRIAADFELEEGIVALVGPSGSGKSTMVSLLAGLLRPHSGEIRFRGETWHSAGEGIRLPPERRPLAVAYQDLRLFPHLTVKKNLLYGRRRPPGRTAQFREVVEAFEIGNLLERRPAALSGGQAQRVSLGRALLAGGDLLLLDEPVSSLDGPLRLRVLDYLAGTRRGDQTMLIVTHDIESIRRLRPHAWLHADFGRIAPHPRPDVIASAETRPRPLLVGESNGHR